MRNGGNIRISQCMIVKNEEKNMKRALSWGKGILCEQIVVDTGSTDRTVELAQSFGAVVYHFPWVDDFSAAKNFAISKAKGDWIAFLDADEVFAPGHELNMIRFLEACLEERGENEVDGISTGWMQMDDQGKVAVAGTQVRIFRNCPGLGYRRRIHEQLCRADGAPVRTADAPDISILHYGYCGEGWEKKRGSRRNLDLILRELEEHPQDHEMLGYLGDEYYSREELGAAEQCYREADENMPDSLDERDQRSAATFLYLLQLSAVRQAPDEELLRIYERAAGLLPKEGDFDFIMGRHFASREQYDQGAAFLELALSKLERYGSTNKSMLLAGNLQEAYENIAQCYGQLGNLQKAVSYSTAVLKSDPNSMTALYTLLKAFRGNVKWNEAAAFLQKLYDFRQLKDRLFVSRTVRELNWKELEEYMESLFTTEEKRIFEEFKMKGEHSEEE